MIKELIENMNKTDEFKAYLAQELIKLNGDFNFLSDLYPLPQRDPPPSN